MRGLATLSTALTVFFAAASVHAASYDALLDKLVDKGVLTRSEAQEVRSELAQEAKKSKGPSSDDMGVPGWVKSWEFSGDIRLRNEFRDRSNRKNANRQRIRTRIGTKVKVGDGVEVGARLATGSLTDPVSTNQSFSTALRKKPFNLDRAYVKYTPTLPMEGTQLSFSGGMISNPLWTPSALVWDGDLSFDGAAVALSQSVGPAKFFSSGGVFSLDTDKGESANLYLVQGGAEIMPSKDSDEEFLKNLKLKGAVSYHDYKNVTSTAETTVIANAGSPGNSSAVEDFDQINTSFEAGSRLAGIPMKTWFDYVHNVGAKSSNDGYQVGMKLGSAKKFLDPKQGWEIGYFYQRLEPDAVFGGFADSDFGGGGANTKGHAYSLKIATVKNSTLSFRYLDAQQVSGSKNHFDTFQVDWQTKF